MSTSTISTDTEQNNQTLKPKTLPKMIALTSATGKLGSAVLDAILKNNLISPSELVVCVRPLPSPQKTPS
jgi:hypothetical protein